MTQDDSELPLDPARTEAEISSGHWITTAEMDTFTRCWEGNRFTVARCEDGPGRREWTIWERGKEASFVRFKNPRQAMRLVDQMIEDLTEWDEDEEAEGVGVDTPVNQQIVTPSVGADAPKQMSATPSELRASRKETTE